MSGSTVRVVSGASPDLLDAAARIWAESTAARDGHPDQAPITEARERIVSALAESPDSFLLTALDAVTDAALGFAAVTPSTAESAQLRYIGVSPAAWRRGVGALLARETAAELRSRGFAGAELWVYQHNYPAITLYETLGWRYDGPTRISERTGRTMLHYTLDLV